MGPRARTPEELEVLLEDALLTRDIDTLSAIFTEGAVLAVGEGRDAARGSEEIARLTTSLCENGRTYLAEPRRVVQARATALVLADRAINVARRGSDGTWRYTIALLSLDPLPDD